jgi:multidrug efflux pump subunit AcrB
MIKFLIRRPIAVLMSFTACFILGLITYFGLPVSLLPDIAIPQITVQVAAGNTSARELENSVVRPLRQQLIQVSTLQDLSSETRDGAAIVRLGFNYGVDTDLAFIEVNEKIDAAMNYLPQGIDRPRVVKASATDIPVFYLNLTLKADTAYQETDMEAFLSMCTLAESVIKRRIEQLPEVAMVDVTGLVESRLLIVPDPTRMAMLELSVGELETILLANDIDAGNIRIRDGYYEYNVKFSTVMRTPEDVENIYIRRGERILQLRDFCDIRVAPDKEEGFSIVNGKRAVTLAIIKQGEETMKRMQAALDACMEDFRTMYPAIEFSVNRNQTELLNYTISNLTQNFLLGFLLVCIIAFLFLRDAKSPFIIGVSMIVSLVMAFLFFYIFHISFNIVSLSGLILALGMMIDNSIIITENITQYREKGYLLNRACIAGTNELITPTLSASLTTIAVFVPLVFMSGIAGAIFFQQAFSVTVGQFVSYATGIFMLPVLYSLIYRRRRGGRKEFTFKSPIKDEMLYRFYDNGVDFTFKHQVLTVLFCIISIPIAVLLFFVMDVERMPHFDQNELEVRVDWNDPIHVEENRARTQHMFSALQTPTTDKVAAIGRQDYLLGDDRELSASEAEWYFKTPRTDEIVLLQAEITQWIRTNYPKAAVSFSPPQTIFEKLFTTGTPDVVAEFYVHNTTVEPSADELRALERRLEAQTGQIPVELTFQNQMELHIDREKLLLYNVAADEVYRVLRTAFKENNVTILRSYQQYLPITIGGEEKTLTTVLQETLVRTLPDDKTKQISFVPLNKIVSVTSSEGLKTIQAGRNGEFIPFAFHRVDNPEQLINEVGTVAGNEWDTTFSGSFFSNKQMMKELVFILLVSLLLMYFILAAQFESFTQPLLVMIEIPIDIAFGMLLLWICGHTLNLMSAIGLIVACGIVVNDSILKLDAINELRKAGMPLLEAIHEAGRRRLRPILMTSLTTIFSMVPLLFSSDMGSELQQPLSLAMMGTMTIGTLVSLFVIPLFYWFIYRKRVGNITV